MNLKKKKELAAETLGVGKKRIVLVGPRLEEIKEILTKQQIRDLHKDGAILIKEIKGRKKKPRKKRKGPGKIKKKVKNKKQEYVKITRKLRKYISELKKQEKISGEEYKDARKKIRNREYRSKSHLKERMNVK